MSTQEGYKASPKPISKKAELYSKLTSYAEDGKVSGVLVIISNYREVLNPNSSEWPSSEDRILAKGRWNRCRGLIEKSIENMGSDHIGKNPDEMKREFEGLTEIFPAAKKEEIAALSAAYKEKYRSSKK